MGDQTFSYAWVMSFFSFPNPVNDKAARTVATGVVLIGVLTLVTGWWWLTVPLALGFVGRVLAGPRLSPLGWLAMKVIGPRLGAPRYTPGPPKRFAQGIGVVFSTTAAVLALGFGQTLAAGIVLGVLVLFATLEAALGFCAGCFVFGHLMRLGVIPQDTCEACADISLRQPVASA
ncbi:MFS transporter permease [Janibacter sp. Soil728]|nr:MFS transporter permease [Janibacter sp. Soil728]